MLELTNGETDVDDAEDAEQHRLEGRIILLLCLKSFIIVYTHSYCGTDHSTDYRSTAVQLMVQLSQLCTRHVHDLDVRWPLLLVMLFVRRESCCTYYYITQRWMSRHDYGFHVQAMWYRLVQRPG